MGYTDESVRQLTMVYEAELRALRRERDEAMERLSRAPSSAQALTLERAQKVEEALKSWQDIAAENAYAAREAMKQRDRLAAELEEYRTGFWRLAEYGGEELLARVEKADTAFRALRARIAERIRAAQNSTEAESPKAKSENT